MKTCPCCGSPFSSDNLRQVYCSVTCRNTQNMQLKRQRLQARRAKMDTLAARKALEGKSHLSITEAAKFLGVSRPTIYTRIEQGELTPLRVSPRTVRIPIEQLKIDSHYISKTGKQDYSELISKAEILEKYSISESWLIHRMKEEGFHSRIIKGKAFYPKKEVERMFKPKPVYNKGDWYNAEDLMKKEGISRKYISYYVREKKIPVKRDGRLLFISKKSWDNSRLFRGDIEKNYLTVDQAKKHYHLGQQTFYEKVNAACIKGTRTGIYVYYKKSDLDRLFKDKTPKVPSEIRKNYMRRCDALKHYHLGQKRFSYETQAAGVTKILTEGNYVWYKKDELDRLFNKINDNGRD